MFLFSRPGEAAIRSFLAAQQDRPFSYTQFGASRSRAPDGYAVFERAADALRRWQMFQIPWMELCWPSTPIEVGATVGVLVSHLGFWSLNACRVVYVVQDHGTCEKFGFAYGTLREHAEVGGERLNFPTAEAGGFRTALCLRIAHLDAMRFPASLLREHSERSM